MSIRLSDKSVVNIPHETDKCKVNNRRYDGFIKNCLDELKAKGETICFDLKQIEEIKKHINIEKTIYNMKDDCYYVFSKR